MTMINEVLEKLEYLKLKESYLYLNELHKTADIPNDSLSLTNDILNASVTTKELNNKLYNVKVAAFPYLATIDDYDFSFQPSIKENKLREICDSNFYEEATNIVFLGNPGVGKTHLSISIGYVVAIKRNSVYFIKFQKLISNLKQAYDEGTLDKKISHYFKYKLLIVDEVGFAEISELESKLFFQLIDKRYGKRSTIITSNIPFEKWTRILGNDEMITKAIIDRLVHYSYLFNITGPSYRLKDKLKPQKL